MSAFFDTNILLCPADRREGQAGARAVELHEAPRPLAKHEQLLMRRSGTIAAARAYLTSLPGGISILIFRERHHASPDSRFSIAEPFLFRHPDPSGVRV